MKKHLITAILYTAVTALVLGLVYPLVLTAIARVAFPHQASGSLITNPQGEITGSTLLGQPFTGDKYFHSRPSNAGTGYDASSSSGSNLGPTSKALTDRTQASIAAEKLPNVPVDLVTASASGLDPDITPAAAYFQLPRIAAQRHLTDTQLRTLIATHTTPRQFGLLGEPRVNVLALNQALDLMK